VVYDAGVRLEVRLNVTISVRLDAKTERLLARLARTTGKTKSAIVRNSKIR
jgi:predicted DNA-binding protein